MIVITTKISMSVNPFAPRPRPGAYRIDLAGHALRIACGYPVIRTVYYTLRRGVTIFSAMTREDGRTLIRWMKREAWIDLLELAFVAALGVGLAHATWLAMSPRAVGAPGMLAQGAQTQPGALAARQLFGVASGEPATRSVATAGGLTLLGVLSSPEPGAGRAIIAVQGSRPALVAAGEPIADGLELREVHADHVIVSRQGVPERIELERGGSRASPPPAPSRAPARK